MTLWSYVDKVRPKRTIAEHDNLFLSWTGKPITVNTVKLVFSRLVKGSGVERLHAHLCRHTFATRFLVNGGDVFTQQQILGHSTLEMVRHYVNLASNQVATLLSLKGSEQSSYCCAAHVESYSVSNPI